MMEYSRKILNDVFGGQKVSPILPYVSLDQDKQTVDALTKGVGHISLSGVQPKYSMVLDDGQLRLTKPQERGTYILKPAPTANFILDKQYCPQNEYLTMQLAREVYGLEVAPCALCYFQTGQAAYITKRFDIGLNGEKLAQEDFASLAGLNKNNAGIDYKYNALSYEEFGEIIQRYVRAYKVELLKFFRLVVFNYITLNDDAHLKNFSLIEKRPKDYVLSPAYDLMNTSLHLTQPSIFAVKKGLFKEGMAMDDTHTITRAHFVEFGHRLGLNETVINRELDRFVTQTEIAKQMIHDSELPEALAKQYYQSYHYRCLTLTF